ncbi:uncharacterized protein [Venturia canescens]|uniref:uncharacterized protein isoform X2 n=1 Tax=Venturia canescens TaxID=32260 RepID=UPI001C9BC02F|nr:uncharacterized protein LOC122413687 isoform X2 [Venturia canescens]
MMFVCLFVVVAAANAKSLGASSSRPNNVIYSIGLMYRCLNCNMPVALSCVSHHSSCFLHQRRIAIDEFNLVNGIQASANSDSAIEEAGGGVCLNTQEEATHRIWNCVVAAMEQNQDMLRHPTDALSISRLNDSWVLLDEELFNNAEGTLDEWKTTIQRWREKTTLKWEILKDIQ